MKIFTIDEKTRVGIGGTFVDSTIEVDTQFFFPESGACRSKRFGFSNSEIIGISNNRLYFVDSHLSAYAVLAEHHYSFALSEGSGGCIFLKNREIAITDGLIIKAWDIDIADWFNFETSTDLHLQEAALCAYAKFASRPNYRENNLIYADLFQCD